MLTYNISMHLSKVYKHIHTSMNYKISMQSPCNIDWIYPTQNMLAKLFVMLKYTLHTFTLTSSHITWVHVTSFQSQSNKIVIYIQ